MVFCGALSKGCERCRTRKVKCDQEKPSCVRCLKANFQCPGYRDLSEVVFRDESQKVARRLQPARHSSALRLNASGSNPGLCPTQLKAMSIRRSLSYPVRDLGASFFFANYSVKEDPHFSGYHSWLKALYLGGDETPFIQEIIEAVGLAGLSNVSPAAELEAKSKEQYCNALAGLKQALNDAARATEDATLMTVILLLLYEIVNFKTWDRYHCWAAHVRAAAALLDLRGHDQFDHERGVQLYIQSRSQILLACTQQYTGVPHGLVKNTCSFQTSATRRHWQERQVASPGSISEICLRTINLRAAMKRGELLDYGVIRSKALELDHDLQAWEEGLSPTWKYSLTTECKIKSDTCFDDQRHVYSSSWIADAWNNRRTVRILVKQIILDNEQGAASPDYTQIDDAVLVIRQMSTDICVSVHSFYDTPRILSLIQPLYFVALLELNSPTIRSFAVEHLRRIASSTGVLQAALLADTASDAITKGAQAASGF